MKRAQNPIRILPQIFLWRVNFTNPDPGRLLRPAMARCKAHALGSTARCRSSLQPGGQGSSVRLKSDVTGPSPPGERTFCRFLSIKAAEINDGAFQSPCPGLDSAVSTVSPAQRIGEQRLRTYHKYRPLPTC